jgi:hypothetical protein
MGLVAEFLFFSHHLLMTTRHRAAKASKNSTVRGRTIAAFGSDVVMVQVRKPKASTIRRDDTASVLVKKAVHALRKPGIKKESVFRGRQADRVFSYSVYLKDPTKIVRETSKGARTIGRLVDGKFRSSKAA